MAKKKVTPTEGEELQPTDPITPTSPEERGSEPTPTEEAPNEDAAEEPVEGGAVAGDEDNFKVVVSEDLSGEV